MLTIMQQFIVPNLTCFTFSIIKSYIGCIVFCITIMKKILILYDVKICLDKVNGFPIGCLRIFMIKENPRENSLGHFFDKTCYFLTLIFTFLFAFFAAFIICLAILESFFTPLIITFFSFLAPLKVLLSTFFRFLASIVIF